MQELRLAFRTLRKSPGFSIPSIATLALAIGINTLMFSVLNAVLFRPLPYRSPDRLVMLWTERPSENLREARSAYGNIEDWRRQSQSFEDIAFWDPVSVTLTQGDHAEQIIVVRVSPNLFSLLGIRLAQGRTFSEQEANGQQRLAVISHHFWQTRFGGSPDAIGASIELDGRTSQVIGILPPGIQFSILDADIWEPYTLFADWDTRRVARGAGSWSVLGRLRDHVSVEQAQTELTTIVRRLDDQLPAADRSSGISVVPLSVHVIAARSRLALWMLTAAVFCVLLIAGANVASLALVRSVGRARELAIRAALGATRGQIVRQLLAESVTLAAVSGVLGIFLAFIGIRLLAAFQPVDLARLNQVSVDLRVLGWALGISFLTGILVGLAPAITTGRWNLRPAADEGGRSISQGIAARRIRRALVAAEFALTIMLLAGAGLLVRSWWSVEHVDPGFRPERVLSMNLRTPTVVAEAERAGFYGRVLEQIASLPGIESAGIVSDLFITSGREQIVVAEGDVRTNPERLQLRRDEASPGFFKTLGIPLLRGRFFSDADGPLAPRAAIINDAFARRIWPGRDPVGKRFALDTNNAGHAWFTVVGVIGDMRRQQLEREPIPQMFEPLAQTPSRAAILLIRTSSSEPLRMVGTVEAAVRRVEKQVPLYQVTTLEDRLSASLKARRFQTLLVVGFSAVSLLMAAIGIYGLIQYSVVTRTQEIGLRMAIGAEASDIFRMIISEGLELSVTGLVVGLVGAWWAGQAASSLLFGVTASDPLTFVTVSVLLVAVAAAACYFPARRAMKVTPIDALRQA